MCSSVVFSASTVVRRTFTMGVRRIWLAVVNHYNRQFQLNLTRQQKADLVEFLKSL
jgi:hypothetical protein